MNIPHCILLLARNGDEKGVKGRTLFQKRMFFLAELLEEEIGFRAHYYGPYSSAVATDLDRMVMTGFLSEETKIIAPSGNPFEDVRCYTYRLTEDGKAVVESWTSEMERVETVLKKLERHPIWNDLKRLVIAAKLQYLRKVSAEELTWEDLTQKAQEYRWEITEEDIETSLQFLKDIGLLKR
jgi:uncharacterized protein YwgA